MQIYICYMQKIKNCKYALIYNSWLTTKTYSTQIVTAVHEEYKFKNYNLSFVEITVYKPK